MLAPGYNLREPPRCMAGCEVRAAASYPGRDPAPVNAGLSGLASGSSVWLSKLPSLMGILPPIVTLSRVKVRMGILAPRRQGRPVVGQSGVFLKHVPTKKNLLLAEANAGRPAIPPPVPDDTFVAADSDLMRLDTDLILVVLATCDEPQVGPAVVQPVAVYVVDVRLWAHGQATHGRAAQNNPVH